MTKPEAVEGPNKDREDFVALPLLTHLVEFRRRFIYALCAVGGGFCVCYFFAPEIYAFLVRPLAAATEGEPRRLIYTGLSEAFITYIKLGLWGGGIVAFPVIAAQIWFYIAPGLYRAEKRALLPFLIAAPVLFVAGAAMAYYIVFPMAWKFFLSFEMPGVAGGLPIQLEARVSEYLSLSMSIIFAFGLAFQLPVVLVVLVRARILSAAQLSQFRRYAIVLIFVIAAVLTPPDVISQISLALPLMALYEAALWAARFVEKGNR
jgi:sec-independent protein translocase protein TatC